MTDLDLQEQETAKEKRVVEGNDNTAPSEAAEAAVSNAEAESEALEEVPETESEAEESAEDAESGDDRPGKEPDPQHLRLLEALLFSSIEPLTERLLKNRLPDGTNVKAVLKKLQGDYADRGIQLVQRGQTWAFRTSPDLATVLNREVEVPRKLSRAAIETLAIIAYHQPVTRAEIEEIRGVIISRGTIDILLELGWIGPRGRRQVPGRPMTWGTTDAFLDHFGLESTKDLPGVEELKAAGLLDASPAIQIYRASVGKDGEEQGVLEEAAGDDADTAGDDAEPLNPDG